MEFFALLSNPWITHILTLVAGWLGLAQPAAIASLWAKIIGVANTVQKAQDMIKMIDSMLKMHNLVPADAPVPTHGDVKAVSEGHMTVEAGKAKLQAMKH
jgi:hypothetical protein